MNIDPFGILENAKKIADQYWKPPPEGEGNNFWKGPEDTGKLAVTNILPIFDPGSNVGEPRSTTTRRRSQTTMSIPTPSHTPGDGPGEDPPPDPSPQDPQDPQDPDPGVRPTPTLTTTSKKDGPPEPTHPPPNEDHGNDNDKDKTERPGNEGPKGRTKTTTTDSSRKATKTPDPNSMRPENSNLGEPNDDMLRAPEQSPTNIIPHETGSSLLSTPTIPANEDSGNDAKDKAADIDKNRDLFSSIDNSNEMTEGKGTSESKQGGDGGSKSRAGPIAGGVVGGLVVLAILAGLLVFALKRRRRRTIYHSKEEAIPFTDSPEVTPYTAVPPPLPPQNNLQSTSVHHSSTPSVGLARSNTAISLPDRDENRVYTDAGGPPSPVLSAHTPDPADRSYDARAPSPIEGAPQKTSIPRLPLYERAGGGSAL